ncbi:Rap1a/Tai family immunity protein [Dankookia sp. GCM10030260]|uniref:Rap1a/Tai family immunity protein n=1 Tax=Dankookia sp. GCM10030260 TaxID=3273390 RepID=UPI003614082B
MRLATMLAAGLAVVSLGSVPVQAQAPTGAAGVVTTATLAEACSASGTDMIGATAIGYCRGFITGAGQYHTEMSVGRTPIFCLPSPSPTLEAVQVSFVAWARANPQRGQEKALDGLLRWASDTYPCPPAPAAAQPAARKPRF